MAPSELLQDIIRRGGTVRADGESLRVIPPPPGLTEADRAALKACKAELLQLVRAAQDANKCSLSTRAHGTTKNSALPPPAPPPRRAYSATPFGRVTEGPCSAPGYRLYSSDLLQEPFMVADVDRPEDAEPEPFIVVYTRAEVALMRGLKPRDVKAIHAMKRDMGGRYTGPAPTKHETFMEAWNRAVAEDLRLYPRAPKETETPAEATARNGSAAPPVDLWA